MFLSEEDMAKLDYSPKTLDDKIVRDGSCAVGTLSDNSFSKGLYFVVGGIATQSYLPSNCRRPTLDLDLAILANLSYSDFKNSFSKTVCEYLCDKGYEVKTRKARRSFCIDFKDDKSNLFFIEFARNSQKTFDGKKEILKREQTNAKSKIIEGTTQNYIVASPEDIIVPKLVRSVNSLRRNPDFEKYIRKMETISEEDIKNNLKKIEDLRIEAIMSPGDIRDAEILRFVSDLYDMRLLSELAGVNKGYFKESACDWMTLTDPTSKKAKDIIAKSVLPDELFLDNLDN